MPAPRHPPAAARSPWLRGLPPVADARARLLVLGSMPGAASLAAGEYYAHPRNLFWPLLAELLGFDAAAPYAERIAALQAAGIALWDVVGRCRRRGSLDAAIEPASMRANALLPFLAAHPRIRTVAFNGRLAEAAWRRLVAPRLPAGLELRRLALPSTSPANAAVPLARKRAAWRRIRACIRA